MLTLLIFVKQLTRNSSTILWKNMRMELIKISNKKTENKQCYTDKKITPFENDFLKASPLLYS